MRIALCHKLYRVTGGAEVFFLETERVLRECGHETLVIASGLPSEANGSSNVQLMSAPDYDGSLINKLRSLPATIYDHEKKNSVKQILKKFQPDLFHAFHLNVHLSPSVVVAASELGIPIVGTFNDYKHICPNYKLFRNNRICTDCGGRHFYRALQHRCCKASLAVSAASMVEAYVHRWLGIYECFDHFTFSSDFMANLTQEMWRPQKVSWSKFRNPFNSAATKAVDAYDDYGVFFGRLVPEKGVDRLIHAATRIGDFPIKIIGDGPEEGALRELVRKVKATNVEFLGPLWGTELTAVLSRARFVVVPSIWHENFPYVINQAFAHGRPVLGADRGGIPELVQHGERGLIFDPDNVDQLAENISQLALNVDQARCMGMSAKIWSDKEFCDDNAYSELMLAYRTADENRRNRR